MSLVSIYSGFNPQFSQFYPIVFGAMWLVDLLFLDRAVMPLWNTPTVTLSTFLTKYYSTNRNVIERSFSSVVIEWSYTIMNIIYFIVVACIAHPSHNLSKVFCIIHTLFFSKKGIVADQMDVYQNNRMLPIICIVGTITLTKIEEI